MAWTTPRTWTTGELVTAAQMNEQVRDNETYLKDQFNTASGHDHDGSDSKQIAWSIMPVSPQVTWIGGLEAVTLSYVGTAGRGHPSGWVEGPSADSIEMLFPFPIPYQLMGRAVVVSEIVMYYYTSGNAYYFDSVTLRRSDLDGTYTDDASYTTDLGNGSYGDANASLLISPVTLANYPYHLVVKCAGNGQYANYRIYGFKVSWSTV